MSDSFYRMPITQEYTSRGCRVNINAGENSTCVDMTVCNLTNNKMRTGRYVFSPVKEPQEWYSNEDILEIKNMINGFLDECGDDVCNQIHFTNQILS